MLRNDLQKTSPSEIIPIYNHECKKGKIVKFSKKDNAPKSEIQASERKTAP
jgi:hypothetical protein